MYHYCTLSRSSWHRLRMYLMQYCEANSTAVDGTWPPFFCVDSRSGATAENTTPFNTVHYQVSGALLHSSAAMNSSVSCDFRSKALRAIWLDVLPVTTDDSYRLPALNSLGQLTLNWPSFDKGEKKEVYCCDIIVLIVLFLCFWRVKDYKVESVYWNIVWWGCETISIS